MIYIENVKLLPVMTTCQDLTVTSGLLLLLVYSLGWESYSVT